MYIVDFYNDMLPLRGIAKNNPEFCMLLFYNIISNKSLVATDSEIKNHRYQAKYASYIRSTQCREINTFAHQIKGYRSKEQFEKFLTDKANYPKIKQELLKNFTSRYKNRNITETNLFSVIADIFDSLIKDAAEEYENSLARTKCDKSNNETQKSINTSNDAISNSTISERCNNTNAVNDITINSVTTSESQANINAHHVADNLNPNNTSSSSMQESIAENNSTLNNESTEASDIEIQNQILSEECNNSNHNDDSIKAHIKIPPTDKNKIMKLAQQILGYMGGIKKATIHRYFKDYTDFDGLNKDADAQQDVKQLQKQFDSYYSKIESANLKLFEYHRKYPDFIQLKELYYKYAQLIKSDFELKYRHEENNINISTKVYEYRKCLEEFINELSI